MKKGRIAILTSLTMLAFAGNSLLCRAALARQDIDAASFTAVRLAAGAATLWLLAKARPSSHSIQGDWRSALALFAYAAGFSFAYLSLTASTGALLLFGAVQVTMVGVAMSRGERLHGLQFLGFALAIGGLIGLLAPGLSAPPLAGAALMLGAGVAWGVYSLRGRGSGDPVAVTAGNFLRAAPIALLAGVAALPWAHADFRGLACAVASGAVASALGYVIWYTALPGMRATSAAIVQLSVPVIATLGGHALLSEPITIRLVLASAAILGGIAIVTGLRRA